MPTKHKTQTPITHNPKIAFELSDDDLQIVTGGTMDCSTALKVSAAYVAAANVMGALNSPSMQAYFAGKADGVLDGACPK